MVKRLWAISSGGHEHLWRLMCPFTQTKRSAACDSIEVNTVMGKAKIPSFRGHRGSRRISHVCGEQFRMNNDPLYLTTVNRISSHWTISGEIPVNTNKAKGHPLLFIHQRQMSGKHRRPWICKSGYEKQRKELRVSSFWSETSRRLVMLKVGASFSGLQLFFRRIYFSRRSLVRSLLEHV